MHLNPFDLPDPARARPDALTRRALFAHTVIAVLTGAEPAPAEKAALDKAIMAAYHHAGISSDRRTWARPAPLLADLAAALRADGTPPAVTLADRLVPYTEGTHAALFAAPTTTRPAGHLVVFSLRDLPEELKAIGTLLALDATWRRVSDPAARGRRRLITVDEAWLLMRDPEGARFLFRMAKASRKHHAGPGRDHPGRRGRPGCRPGPRGHRQLRHPDPAPPVPAGHRQGRRRVPPVRRGTLSAPVGGQGNRSPGGRPVRPGLFRSAGLAGRKRLVHQRPGRDRPPASPPARRSGRRPAAARRR